MKIINDLLFDSFDNDEKSYVFQIFPNVFRDQRGQFSEVLKTGNDLPTWMSDFSWIKQINRSISKSGSVRGCHTQVGKFCQGKLVSAINTKIYDIIIDARPNSKTFRMTCTYTLDPELQNMLWVPRGFLHSFVVPQCNDDAIFQYFCDNVYDKASETGVNPMTILPKVIQQLKESKSNNNDEFDELFKLFDNKELLLLSDKDCKAEEYMSWMNDKKQQYDNFNTLWYKQ